MAVINLLGSSSLCGEAFFDRCKFNHKVLKYSRKNKDSINIDFDDILSFEKLNLDLLKESYIVSFAPIWLTSKFIEYILKIEKYHRYPVHI